MTGPVAAGSQRASRAPSAPLPPSAVPERPARRLSPRWGPGSRAEPPQGAPARPGAERRGPAGLAVPAAPRPGPSSRPPPPRPGLGRPFRHGEQQRLQGRIHRRGQVQAGAEDRLGLLRGHLLGHQHHQRGGKGGTRPSTRSESGAALPEAGCWFLLSPPTPPPSPSPGRGFFPSRPWCPLPPSACLVSVREKIAIVGERTLSLTSGWRRLPPIVSVLLLCWGTLYLTFINGNRNKEDPLFLQLIFTFFFFSFLPLTALSCKEETPVYVPRHLYGSEDITFPAQFHDLGWMFVHKSSR